MFNDIPSGPTGPPAPSDMPYPNVGAPQNLVVTQSTFTGLPNFPITDFPNPTFLYNNQYLPDVWRVNAGDTISVDLSVQGLDFSAYDVLMKGSAYTNVHFHGMNVSPLGNADNVFRQFAPDNSPTGPYSVPLPFDKTKPQFNHPSGTFWFHPHPHGISEPQVLGGMSGLIMVDGLLENYYPDSAFLAATEKFFLLKDYLPRGADCVQKTINGVATGMVNDGSKAPTQTKLGLINPPAGVDQLWRFANVGADQYFDLVLIDQNGKPQTMNVIAIDGNPTATTDSNFANPVAAPIPMTHLFLSPGARMDVVVNLSAGVYNLWSDTYDTGSTNTVQLGDSNCAVQLAYVKAGPSGTPGGPRGVSIASNNKPVLRPTIKDLQQAACEDDFTVTFTESANVFYINGTAYQPTDPAHIVKLGCIGEWTIDNKTDEAHVFHIHQLDYLVYPQDYSMFRDGDTFNDNYLLFQDVVNVPPQQSVTVYIPFTNPVIAGKFVFHCHILNHEDGGMMANVCVEANPGDCSTGQAASHKTHH